MQDGLNQAELHETPAMVEEDFNTVLGESKVCVAALYLFFDAAIHVAQSSLKRSLVFVGGIIRGYLRRGRNRDFIRTMRRLEARSKSSPFDSFATLDDSAQSTAAATDGHAQAAPSGSKALNAALEEAGMHGLIAPMQAYIAPPRLTINVVHRTGNVWDSVAKLWQFRHEPVLFDRVVAQVRILVAASVYFIDVSHIALMQLYDHATHSVTELHFFLPQLANMLLHERRDTSVASSDADSGRGSSGSSSLLEQFFLHHASQSVHFALRAYMTVNAAMHDPNGPHR